MVEQQIKRPMLASFDLVVSGLVLEHLRDLDDFFRLHRHSKLVERHRVSESCARKRADDLLS